MYSNPKCERRECLEGCSKDTEMHRVHEPELGYVYQSLCAYCCIRTLQDAKDKWKKKYNNLKSVIIFLVACVIVVIYQYIFYVLKM